MNCLKRFLRDESGQAMAEYGLVIAVIVSAVIGALTAFQEARENLFDTIADKFTAAIGQGE